MYSWQTRTDINRELTFGPLQNPCSHSHNTADWIAYLLEYLVRRGRLDERGDVDVDESGHQELAVEPVHDPTVTGDQVTKVLPACGNTSLITDGIRSDDVTTTDQGITSHQTTNGTSSVYHGSSTT